MRTQSANQIQLLPVCSFLGITETWTCWAQLRPVTTINKSPNEVMNGVMAKYGQRRLVGVDEERSVGRRDAVQSANFFGAGDGLAERRNGRALIGRRRAASGSTTGAASVPVVP